MRNPIKLQLLTLLATFCFLLPYQIGYGQAWCYPPESISIALEDFDNTNPHWENDIIDFLFTDPNNPQRGLFIQSASSMHPEFSGMTLYGRDLQGDPGAPSLSPFEFTFSNTYFLYGGDYCSYINYAAVLNADDSLKLSVYNQDGSLYFEDEIEGNGTNMVNGILYFYFPLDSFYIKIHGNIDGIDNWFEIDNIMHRWVGDLPVAYEHFRAKAIGNEVLLDWKTSEELNNQGFDIERSYDGITFTTIGHVYADEINTEGRDYQFLDKNPGAELLYYRLNQIDADGTHTYSDIISVVMDAGNELKLDVQQGQLRFLHAQQDQKIAFSIYDLSGKLIQQGQVIGENYVQTTPQSGIYLIHYNQNGAMLQAKVLLR